MNYQKISCLDSLGPYSNLLSNFCGLYVNLLMSEWMNQPVSQEYYFYYINTDGLF